MLHFFQQGALAWTLATGVKDAPYLAAVADSANVPAALFVAIAEVEGGRSGRNNLVGKAGELGRMQINPSVWCRVADSACVRRLKGYRHNVRRAAAILRWCYDHHGSWCVATRCYNGDIRSPDTVRYLAKVERVLGRIVLASEEAQ